MDRLGRVVLPVELRRTFDIDAGDPLEIYVNADGIILKRYEKACIFCGSTEDEMLKTFMERTVCADCSKKLNSN